MSTTIRGFEHALWASHNLAEYGDFSDKTSDCNQRDIGDCTAGNWFYIPDEPVTSDHGTFRVIYHGSWGNYNSPGADEYTYAELFDVNDEGDMEEFDQQREEWENAPSGWRRTRTTRTTRTRISTSTTARRAAGTTATWDRTSGHRL